MASFRTIVDRVILPAAFLGAISCGAREPQPESPEPATKRTVSTIVAKPLPDSAFRIEWSVPRPSIPREMQAGESKTFTIKVRNISDQIWPDPVRAGSPGGALAVRLSYRWLSRGERKSAMGYTVRVDLPGAIAPGESSVLTVETVAPAVPGDYRLQFDLVQELYSWFEAKGAARLIFPVTVE